MLPTSLAKSLTSHQCRRDGYPMCSSIQGGQENRSGWEERPKTAWMKNDKGKHWWLVGAWSCPGYEDKPSGSVEHPYSVISALMWYFLVWYCYICLNEPARRRHIHRRGDRKRSRMSPNQKHTACSVILIKKLSTKDHVKFNKLTLSLSQNFEDVKLTSAGHWWIQDTILTFTVGKYLFGYALRQKCEFIFTLKLT